MHILRYPDGSELKRALARPSLSLAEMELKVLPIMEAVRTEGDKACLEFTERFDKLKLTSHILSEKRLDNALEEIDPELRQALEIAYQNIHAFHSIQKTEVREFETMPGVLCRQRDLPIEKVGLYVPGGSSPLFSTVLMLAVPALIAGCSRIVLCTPPGPDGLPDKVTLAAARLCGLNEVFAIGGAQAVAAMAYGTECIPAVDKIFGPGNQWVTAAKQIISRQGIAIDMPAGPSEVAVIADETSDPRFIAADLLSQAEHGPDSQVLLFSDSDKLISDVESAVKRFLPDLPRRSIAAEALQHSSLILLKNVDEILKISDEYAPEHLIIHNRNADQLAERVKNAGAVFIGALSPESAGDYAGGTNHTLPTGGYARNTSGLSLRDFTKTVSYLKLSPPGVQQLAPTVEKMAAAEGLHAHELAMKLRRDSINK